MICEMVTGTPGASAVFLGGVVSYANEVSEKAALPIKMTTVKSDLYDALKDKIENLMPIELYVRQSFAERNE